jgi:transcriptional antiterminator Rof (Rho-off)
MELSNLMTADDHAAGAECNIFSPVDGKLTDVFILVAGADSPVWRKSKRKQTTEIMAVARSKDTVDLDYDKMDIEALVEATLGWRGIVKNGEPWECSKANALDLYSKSPGIVSQLLDFIADKRNFTKG